MPGRLEVPLLSVGLRPGNVLLRNCDLLAQPSGRAGDEVALFEQAGQALDHPPEVNPTSSCSSKGRAP